MSELGQLREELRPAVPRALSDMEFKVFSQFGEDGILSWLTRGFSLEHRTFVEIGVGSYAEANTRYLASRSRNPWRGFIFDCEPDHLDFGRHPESWKWSVFPVQATVRPDNVNELLGAAGVSSEIGLLSLDIDGIDYWVWDALSATSPRIFVAEYNYVFGPSAAVTVPKAQSFDIRSAHSSRLYFGTSLQAMVSLSKSRGYTFVGATSAGVNAFFVRNDLLAEVWPGFSGTSVQAEWRDGGFGNARNSDGDLVRLTLAEKQGAIALCTVLDLETQTTRLVGEVL